jgi:hypothetical protein
MRVVFEDLFEYDHESLLIAPAFWEAVETALVHFAEFRLRCNEVSESVSSRFYYIRLD